MSLKEAAKKYVIKFMFVIVSGIMLFFSGIESAEVASLPTTSQINRMQELTPLYKSYKLEQDSGTVDKSLSFGDYIETNPEYGKVYNGIEFSARKSSGKKIEILGKDKKNDQLIFYDDSTTPALDWFKGSKKPKPDITP
ncbi:MAG: hypothetical protein PHF08_12735 [Candidatus Riflebacteria bacterium]|jgi:hypothetical protein|nr:hypothetical protein [Candidatus Riflebacteria bacterium]NCB47742.1 hypothetical protein [bacterium]